MWTDFALLSLMVGCLEATGLANYDLVSHPHASSQIARADNEQFPLLASLPATVSLINPDGVGKLPTLGWNSWNAFQCSINENKILSAAQQMVDLGLKDAGYQYVSLDDCWSNKTGRDSNGRLMPDAIAFPHGISGLAERIHALGLKIGIYSSSGTETCAGYPGSIGYEETDAETWASWGVDLLKLDNCNVPDGFRDFCEACNKDWPNSANGSCTGSQYCSDSYDFSQSITAQRFRTMRDALKKQNRTILYSICEWGIAGVQGWGNATGNSWRSTGDIYPEWQRILSILNQNSFYMNYVDFWGHSDPDMLEVGNGELTPEETRSHFALWAAMKAPLLIGTDLTKISSQNVALLTNKALLSFNQDPVHGPPAQPYKWGTNPNWTFNATHPAEYWAGTFSDGVLVLALNTASSKQTKRIDFGEVPMLKEGGSYVVTDVWSGRSQGCMTGSINTVVASHDTAVYVVGVECIPSSTYLSVNQ